MKGVCEQIVPQQDRSFVAPFGIDGGGVPPDHSLIEHVVVHERGGMNHFDHRGEYGIVNILYYPVKNMLLGPEFQWGKRTNWHDGYSYNDYKIQFSVKYNFKYHLGAL